MTCKKLIFTKSACKVVNQVKVPKPNTKRKPASVKSKFFQVTLPLIVPVNIRKPPSVKPAKNEIERKESVQALV